jgi:type IV pilus assembly protein PilM
MLQTKSFLAVDFGAGSLKLAEFEVNEAGGLRLKQYGIKSLGLEGAQENTREATILKALQALISEMGIKSKECNVCAPGFHVFSKFVKLPPVEQSKVTQIIQYEAQQNVPFPLSEVVWDYQILGQAAGGELEVLLVAIKSEIVEGLFRVADAASLKLQVADVSPAALCNSFKFNYGDLDDCTMLLDIGAKTSNLLFFEKGKVYSRSINLGANSITQDFAAESKMKFDVAEKIKVEEGFVSLGGAYEEPENPNQAAISKIARQFMTRLHIQVNQTMQFYRGQQGGSQPARLFLSGGASIMPYTAQFFAEKLNVPVEYFNPFRNVQIDPTVNLEELARVAHSMGEVVGLGLRNLAHCPVELNLMPESTRKWRAFNEKKPFLIATVFTMVVVVAVLGLLFQQLGSVKEEKLAKIKPALEEAQRRDNEFTQAKSALDKATNDLSQMTSLINDRYYWVDTLPELRRVLMQVEMTASNKWGSAAGIWVEQFVSPSVEPVATSEVGYQATPVAFGSTVESTIETKYGLGTDAQQPGQMAPVPVPGSGVTTFIMVCRARKGADASANSELMYAFLDDLKASPFVDPKTTQVGGRMGDDDSPYTFTFAVKVGLKNPLKL